MKKITLDNLVKVVAVAVAVVFVYSKVFPSVSFSDNVYGEQTETQAQSTTSEDFATVSEENSYEEIQGTVVEGVQVIEFDLRANSYPTLNLKANTPVKLVINVAEDTLNSCNYRIISEELGIQSQLGVGQNIIEFTPGEANQYVYTCWMGMIGAYVNVYDDVEPSAFYGENLSAGGCCSFK